MPLSDQLHIPLVEVKLFLRIDYDYDDPLLSTMTQTALDMIDGFLGYDFSAVNYEGIPRSYSLDLTAAREAALHLIAHLYEHRGDEPDMESGLPASVQAILQPLPRWFSV